MRTANVHNVSVQQVRRCVHLAVGNIKCIYNREIIGKYHMRYFLYNLYFITGTMRTANVHNVNVQQVWRCIHLTVRNTECMYNREINRNYHIKYFLYILYFITGTLRTANVHTVSVHCTASLTLYTSCGTKYKVHL